MGRTKIALKPIGATEALDLPPGPGSIDVSAVRQRKDGDTRGLSAGHVVMLAESIGTLGLLEPIIVDTKGQLLAGGHRLAAAQLLAIADGAERRTVFLDRSGHTAEEYDTEKSASKTNKAYKASEWVDLADHMGEALPRDEFASRYPKGEIPVVVVDIAGKDNKSLALAIEVAENSVRRPYTIEEIKDLAARLKQAGYKASPGRPKEGEVSAISLLQAAVGKSRRTIDRILKGQKPGGKDPWGNAKATFRRVAKRLLQEGKSKRGENDVKLMELAEKAVKLTAAKEGGSK